MSISNNASKVTLPSDSSFATVLEFLCHRFPHISAQEWKDRVLGQKVYWQVSTDEDHTPVDIDSAYQAGATIYYYREVEKEPSVPFKEQIIEHNEHFIIAHKPPFLPVMPGGAFVNECLQERLIQRTGIKELQAVHRLDRDTSGIVMFSTSQGTRRNYHQLFSEQKILKEYQAIAKVPASLSIAGKKWHIKNYLTRGKPKFRFKNTNDPSQGQYAESLIECIEQNQDHGLFKLTPITGRTHQLRLHMMEIGYPILNDRFYPELQAKEQENFDSPLKLLAATLSFIDPVSQEELTFKSPTQLKI